MDNHKLVMIFNLHDKIWFFFIENIQKNFRIWLYSRKKIYFFVFLKWGIVLEFFGFVLNFKRKPLFLILVSYLIVQIYDPILNKVLKKHIFMFFK